MKKTLYVFYNDEQVGTLSVDNNHQYRFSYVESWLASASVFPLSCSLLLPVVAEAEISLAHNVSYSFFSNLIPEGDLRDKLAMQLGISDQNDFALLEVVGGDVAGAISLYSHFDIPKSTSIKAKKLTQKDLAYVLEKLKTHPFLVNSDELNKGEKLRLSLAGAEVIKRKRVKLHFCNNSL